MLPPPQIAIKCYNNKIIRCIAVQNVVFAKTKNMKKIGSGWSVNAWQLSKFRILTFYVCVCVCIDRRYTCTLYTDEFSLYFMQIKRKENAQNKQNKTQQQQQQQKCYWWLKMLLYKSKTLNVNQIHFKSHTLT